MQLVVPFTTPGAPLSRQGCWAWPGALQVGSIMDPKNKTALDLPWNRAHFAAWCVISSPLVLEIDLGNTPAAQRLLQQAAPILTHPGAIAINQAWAGSPGQLLMSSDPSNPVKYGTFRLNFHRFDLFSCICAGIHMCGARASPVCA